MVHVPVQLSAVGRPNLSGRGVVDQNAVSTHVDHHHAILQRIEGRLELGSLDPKFLFGALQVSDVDESTDCSADPSFGVQQGARVAVEVAKAAGRQHHADIDVPYDRFQGSRLLYGQLAGLQFDSVAKKAPVCQIRRRPVLSRNGQGQVVSRAVAGNIPAFRIGRNPDGHGCRVHHPLAALFFHDAAACDVNIDPHHPQRLSLLVIAELSAAVNPAPTAVFRPDTEIEGHRGSLLRKAGLQSCFDHLAIVGVQTAIPER